MATNYITIHDLAETTSGNVSEDAEFIINNGTDAVVATKAKLSSILAETKADIANLDGDIANVEADVIELQNDKMNIDHSNDSKPYIVETYDDGNGNGYRVWSNKFCEQWGCKTSSGTITFLKEYKNDNVGVIICRNSSYEGGIDKGFHGSWTKVPTATGFSCFCDNNTAYSWFSKGYIL